MACSCLNMYAYTYAYRYISINLLNTSIVIAFRFRPCAAAATAATERDDEVNHGIIVESWGISNNQLHWQCWSHSGNDEFNKCSKHQYKAKIWPQQQVPMHNKLCLPRQLNVEHQKTTVVVVVMMTNLKLIHSNIIWKKWC